MAGNVWEWTRSLWGMSLERPDYRYPYRPTDGREVPDAGREVARVLRGAAFMLGHWHVRCAHRLWSFPNVSLRHLGFRVVMHP
jgi:formylglycine-generating enzyme required for sulfatase activity